MHRFVSKHINFYPSSVNASLRNINRRVHYTDKIKLAILDWSGTTIDPHVIAPAVSFVNVFKKHGVPITMSEARKPMGLRKDLHIQEILKMPDVIKRWKDSKGYAPTDNDAELLFSDYIPLQNECLPQYTTLLPNVINTAKYLRNNLNIKIGTTTGFTRSMVDVILENTKKQGYTPDTNVAGDEIDNGLGRRPNPFMIYRNMLNLDIWPIQSVVKVDDTVGGVGEGLNAGCWTVGISSFSNYNDIDDLEHWNGLTNQEKNDKIANSRDILINSNAHYVIDDISQLPFVIKEINFRLSSGEHP